MKYLIPLFILLSSLLSASKISQEVIDKHFDFCLSDAKKTEKQQVICDNFWIPYGAGEDTHLSAIPDSYNFHPYQGVYGDDTDNVDSEGYRALMGKLIYIKTTDEFGDTKTIETDQAYQTFIKRLSKAKSQSERKNEMKNYYLAYYKMTGGIVQTICDSTEWIQYTTAEKSVLESFVQKGYIPSSVTVSLNDKKAKNGALNASYDSYGLYLKFAKYAFIYRYNFMGVNNPKTSIRKRQLLLYSFLVYKERSFKYGDGGSKYNFSSYNAYLTLYRLAKAGDYDAIKLITLLASGDAKKVSNYLLSMPGVKYYFNFFNKELDL